MTIVEFLTARYDEATAEADAAAEGHPHWRAGAYRDGMTDEWVEIEDSGLVVESDTSETVISDEGRPDFYQAQFIARHDPASVLADVAAKRRIVNSFAAASEDVMTTRTEGAAVARMVLKLLALPYADHPDYRPEWKS